MRFRYTKNVACFNFLLRLVKCSELKHGFISGLSYICSYTNAWYKLVMLQPPASGKTGINELIYYAQYKQQRNQASP